MRTELIVREYGRLSTAAPSLHPVCPRESLAIHKAVHEGEQVNGAVLGPVLLDFVLYLPC